MSLVSDECERAKTAGGKGRVFDVLRQRGPIRPADPDLDAWIAKTFPGDTDDRWLAEKLVALGSEPRWPLVDLQERQRRATVEGRQWSAEPGAIEANLPAPSSSGGDLRVLFFPGVSQRRAMIISGVHGDELAGVEVVETLLPTLRTATRAFSIMVVPRVFAANCRARRRKTSDKSRDPNRQMPTPGDIPRPMTPEEWWDTVDGKKVGPTKHAAATPVENPNQALLELIQRFQPERLVSVHGVSKNNDLAGITTDFRPGFEAADKQLALDMARAAEAKTNGSVPGNHLASKPTATYPTSTQYHEPGFSLGQWGSAAAAPRAAINMILIETHGKAETTGSQDACSVRDRDALVGAILGPFLKP